MTSLLVAVTAAVAAFGALWMASAWSPPPAAKVTVARDWEALGWRLAAGVAAAVVAFAVTGWVVAAAASGVGGYVAAGWWQRRGSSPRFEQARIEALASWCEQLRDLLSAEHGIIGTITATAATCPEPLRAEVERLAARLPRESHRVAVREFADELDDPQGDLVASVLLLALSRSSRTSELLSELAVTIRERAAMRLRVEAERAGHRSEARFVVVFAAVVVTAIVVFGRDSDFLDAYDDAAGQAVLALVVVCFAAGIRWLGRLTRFGRPARFLNVADVEGGAE